MQEKLEFDPVHGVLRDAEGQILKNEHSPKRKSWSTLTNNADSKELNEDTDRQHVKTAAL